ncbi:NAD-dependent epimerase/dehydratase family protein [Sphingobacterium sp. NPDC055431]
MKVLITGASGFVGQNLSQYLILQNEYEIMDVSLRDSSWKTISLNGFDAIIHLAGKAHDTSNTSNPEEYFTINRDLTISLFNMFLTSDVRDFFYFSSVKAVADTIDEVLSEDIFANPLTSYGKSKLEAEEYLLSKELPKGKRFFIIRPCMIHGPGNKGNLNLLFNFVKQGIPWPLGAFDNQRSFLSIGNLCFLIEKMLKDESLDSGIYNFSDDKSLSTNELVALIGRTLGRNPKIWRINRKVISDLAKFGDKLSLPLNSERLKKLTESYVVSNQKIKTKLSIEQLPISVEDGLITTIQSFNVNVK